MADGALSWERWAKWFYPSLLCGALGYAVYQHGGQALADWNVSLLIIGVAAVGYWGITPTRRLAPAMERLPGSWRC